MKAGKVIIHEELILSWLLFQPGKILKVEFDPLKGTMELTIEHPEMPDLKPDGIVETVNPGYVVEQTGGMFNYRREPLKIS